jgi:hypothetical protein
MPSLQKEKEGSCVLVGNQNKYCVVMIKIKQDLRFVQAAKPAIIPERRKRPLLFWLLAKIKRTVDASRKYMRGMSAVWNVEKSKRLGVASKMIVATAA